MLISPEELRVPDYIIKDVLEANGIEYRDVYKRQARRCATIRSTTSTAAA